jgi:hypothetical protein
LAVITVQITIQQTIPALNGAAIDAILLWLKNNVTLQLPSTATANISFTNITP